MDESRKADFGTFKKAAASTVIKAMRVLDILLELHILQPKGASLKEIAARSDESPSNVCKYLASFQQAGLVEQDPKTDLYRIGHYALKLSTPLLNESGIRELARPYLQSLSEQISETVHLVIRDGLEAVYIDKVESSQTIRMHSQVGGRNPLYCTGVGKAILAFSPQPLTQRVIEAGLAAFTDSTLATSDKLLTDLAVIRTRGYAIDDGEHEPDVRCVAAPVFNHMNEVVASISAAGPLWRLPDERLPAIGEHVRSAAQAISELLRN
ncbi:IclR family transcriptional regulator [Paenibacillus eucommiae]|uniref:DNA-binding IclR family transcriptional regulator n=1 Tax=Paenibacillus eucommiae TaxID=1355755 RepID=A0ABS4J6Y1_9BACL|nr:IclR family transcriptional regulator [Paenibacillus eucommiae]MBP1995616.1 DNA-binding IclR family transcriptional regulator [Paenibacillus eucommiae]